MNTRNQFRVLYREFLFRLVDLEMLAPGGDVVRLLGRFAGALVFLSFADAFGAMFFPPPGLPAPAILAVLAVKQHGLIARTMLVVGLFSVLSWESTFPNRRDVFVLGPLPLRARTLFLAKAAALGTALGVAILTLNSLSGIAWPVVFAPPGIAGILRSLAAYWISVVLAGTFILASVLLIQGLAAQLPRRYYLRMSALLQVGALTLFLAVFFLQPDLATPQALAARQNTIAWLPSYWFWGLERQLAGTGGSIFATLASRAILGFAVALAGAASVYLLSYFRTLRRIVEEPDIAPSRRGISWSPRFGGLFETAIVLFSVRTLLRSRQHRVVLAFYLGFAFAVTILLTQSPQVQKAARTGSLSAPWIIASLMVLVAWLAGTRIVFALPLDLRANWIFRVVPIPHPSRCIKAARRALLTLAIAPVCIGSAVVFLTEWHWRPAAEHLLVLAIFGMILADASLAGFHKLPFTCSYLPGKSPTQIMLLYGWVITLIPLQGGLYERSVLEDPAAYVRMLAILAAAALAIRWSIRSRANAPEAVTIFEEAEEPAILGMGLTAAAGFASQQRINPRERA